MKIKAIVLCLLFLVACTTDDGYETIIVKEFLKDTTLIGEIIDIFPVPHCPENILILDSLLIFKNGDMCDGLFFYVYDKNSHNHLGSFGNRGRGPNEFLSIKTNGQYSLTNNSISIWVQDRLGLKLINIARSLETKEIVVDDELLYISREFHPIIDVFLLSNGDFTGKSLNQTGRLFYYDKENNQTSYIEYFPKVRRLPFDENMIDNLYIGPTRISNDNSKIVSALELFKRIDVFTAETDHLFSIVFDDSPENPDFFINSNDPIPGTLMHFYYDLFLTENYIYALNINMSEDKLNREVDTGYSEIHVFSWEGEPVALYRLNHLIYSVTIDEENDYLYGLLLPTGDEIESQLVRFKLL